MKHTLVATLADQPSTLNRVVSLFRQRGFAIESLTIGRTHEPQVSRMTLVIDGSKSAVEQVIKQLYKVIEVRKVSDLTQDSKVERELALIKVFSRNSSMRAEIMQVTDIYRARVVDVAHNSLTVEVTGPSDKVDSLIGLLRPYGIKELVRTGVVAMGRGGAGASQKEQQSAPSTTRGEPTNIKQIVAV